MTEKETIENLLEFQKIALMALNYGHEWTPDTDELILLYQTTTKAIEIIQNK